MMIFWENLERRIIAMAIQLNHTEKPGVSNMAKSSYYRAAIILLCTAIEGMVYQLVKKHTQPNNSLGQTKHFQELHRIPQNIFGSPGIFCLCEQVKKNIHIDDNGVGFGKLNLFLKNKQLITEGEYEMLDLVRIERNRIHLQGLSNDDTGYTKTKFNKISKTLEFLLKKLP